MYEGVHVESGGSTTVSRFAATAARLGYAGIVVRNHHQMMVDFSREEIEGEYDLDVVDAVEIRDADRTEASGYIGSHRSDTTILLLRGGDPDINRFAAEQERVDVLAEPMRGDGDVNHVIMEAAAANDVHIEVSLGPVLRKSGGPRVKALRSLRKLRELIEAFDAPYVVSAGPRTHLHVRAPRELVALGEQIGFDREAIETGLHAWGSIADTNRERQSPEYINPGVRRSGKRDDQEF
ncbi:MAG: RNase P subunit p30 family protein [Halodesulfurarchaeum sp.]